MKIIGMGAPQYSSRDGIIVEGCKSILNIAQFDRYIYNNDLQDQAPADFYPDEKFDLFVYCGTPWIWDQMQFTAKYRNVLNAIKAHPEAKIVWLGIGSSLYLQDMTSNILKSKADQYMLKQTFKNQTVIVRDSLAQSLIKPVKDQHYLPCPAFFNNPVCETSREVNVAFYHVIKTGISNGGWTQENIEIYRETFRKFVMDNKAQIVVCEPEEVPLAEIIFKRNDIHLIKHNVDTFYWCKKANKVLSGRIHNVVPAIVYGAEVGLVPVDSRHLTVTDWFDIKITNETELHKIKKCDITELVKLKEVYREIIFKGIKC
jgi:ribosomal protein L25 (general stress protein Ctc)